MKTRFPIRVGSSAVFGSLLLLFSAVANAAQSAKPERIGVIHLGGVLARVADGLRAELKELGLEDGKQITLEVYDLKGEAKEVEAIAQKLEQEKVRLIFTN